MREYAHKTGKTRKMELRELPSKALGASSVTYLHGPRLKKVR